MPSLRNFQDQTEAQMAASLLQASGIEARVVGSRDYVSYVVGGLRGFYQLVVPEEQVQEAQKILAQTELMQAEDLRPHRNYMGRAIFFACAAVAFIPIVFNIVSLMNAKLFWDYSAKDRQAVIRLIGIVLLQIPGLAVAAFFLRFWILSGSI